MLLVGLVVVAVVAYLVTRGQGKHPYMRSSRSRLFLRQYGRLPMESKGEEPHEHLLSRML